MNNGLLDKYLIENFNLHMKKKRKKYATGTKIKGYMENPYTELQLDKINNAKAMYEGETDPAVLALKLLGGLGMQAGLSAGGFGNSMVGETANSLLPILSNIPLGFGGEVPNIPVEIEGNEVGETPNGTVFQAKGPSHEQGGININLPEGTEIFSDRIKIDGVSMADRKKKRKKKEITLKKLLEDNIDMLSKNSLERTRHVNTKEENFDINIQNIVSTLLDKNNNKNKYKDGGIVNGLTFGDSIGIVGNLISTFGPYFKTLQNRSEDTPNINPYLHYGEKGLQTINDAQKYLDQIKDENLMDLDLTENTLVKRNRNSSRGVNTMRALDMVTNQNINNSRSNVHSTFAQQMMNMLSQKSQLENQQDKIVMGGEDMRDTKDRQDNDNFFTQLTNNISNIGTGLQEIGYDINKVKQKEIINNMINELSKYDLAFDKKGNIISKKHNKNG